MTCLLTFVADDTLNLYVVAPDGSNVNKLTLGFTHVGDLPTWSPDSRWIAFTATRGSGYGLYVIRPDGTSLHRIAPHVARTISGELAWYPEDTHVAYEGSTPRCRRVGIFVARLDGGGSRRLTNACR